MEPARFTLLSEDEFVKHFFELNKKDEEADQDEVRPSSVVSKGNKAESIAESIAESDNECMESSKEPKRKRRANLAEFSETQTTKRKNEAAKRELTSIVSQLGKIDKQLNAEKPESRVSINFHAKFTSFNSNRISTFNYPPDARVKQTFLDYDATVSVIKHVMKETVTDIVKTLPKSKPDDAAPLEITPTKSSAGIQAFPSPAAGPRSVSRSLCSKNSCSFGKKLKKPVWIKCKHCNQDGYECNYWVHSPCIGLATATDVDVRQLNWYCPDHTDIIMKQK